MEPNFITQIIDEHLESGRYNKVITRFPPEPNGYLHIGHASSICLNFGLSAHYAETNPGLETRTHLRFDDTNPAKEEQEYVDAIQADIKWLGFNWNEHLYYASDTFETLYTYANKLIDQGNAYICELNAEDMRAYRGTLTDAGKNSPFRDRPIAESKDLFSRMRAGEFEEGTHTLRAKIDMASPNINMRDPVMYRILKKEHHRTGNTWCIYPSYDFTHGQGDSLEGITHSICTLEFEDHRPLYEWFIEKLGIYAPQQIEFARREPNYTITSKRKLLQLVNENHVSGWTDPRMPTIAGMRRRGYPAQALRNFSAKSGVARRNNVSDYSLLEFCVRESLNKTAPRYMAVLNPIKVTITNFPEGTENGVINLTGINNPEDDTAGTREVPFTKELYIERDDFMEDAPKKYFRLKPGGEVRLRFGYFIQCNEVIKDASGNITQLKCTYDPETLGVSAAPDGRKVKATIHWVSATHAHTAGVNIYDRLFSTENPNKPPAEKPDGNFIDNLNPNSLTTTTAYIEPALAAAHPAKPPTLECSPYTFQLERLGYFCFDTESKPNAPIINKTVGLRDSWAKAAK